MDTYKMVKKVIEGIISQGGQSKDQDKKTCLYRGPNDRKCAMGWIIPDSLYDKSMEDNSVSSLLESFPTLRENLNLTANQKEIMEMMQQAHDLVGIKWNFQVWKGYMLGAITVKIQMVNYNKGSDWFTVKELIKELIPDDLY